MYILDISLIISDFENTYYPNDINRKQIEEVLPKTYLYYGRKDVPEKVHTLIEYYKVLYKGADNLEFSVIALIICS